MISDAEKAAFTRTVDMLKRSNAQFTEYRDEYSDLRTFLEHGDLAFVHNMGMLAAKGRLVDEANSLGSALLDAGHPGSLVSICAAGLEAGPVEGKPVYLKSLERAAQTGHFLARSMILKQRYDHLGKLALPFLAFHRCVIAAKIFKCAVTDPQDLRLDRGPKPTRSRNAISR